MLLEHVRCMRFAGRRQFPVNLAISRSNPAISRSIPAISRSNPAISRSSIATNFCKKSCSWLRSGIGVFKSQFSDTRRGFDMLVGDLTCSSGICHDRPRKNRSTASTPPGACKRTPGNWSQEAQHGIPSRTTSGRNAYSPSVRPWHKHVLTFTKSDQEMLGGYLTNLQYFLGRTFFSIIQNKIK